MTTRVNPLPGLTGLGKNSLPGLISSPSSTAYVKVVVLSNSSGVWTVPSDAIGPCVIEAWAPGGNGGTGTGDPAFNTGGNGAAGGGSGALGVFTTKLLSAGAQISYTIGQSSGNSTTILGGTANSGGNASGATAGTGGTASGFDVNITGSAGGATASQYQTNQTFTASSGSSGTNAISNGGFRGWGFASSAGNFAVRPGGGGAGAPSWEYSPVGGGAGGNGGSAFSASTQAKNDIGSAGFAPGGGGGGGGTTNQGAESAGGSGAAGRIRITYSANTP